MMRAKRFISFAAVLFLMFGMFFSNSAGITAHEPSGGCVLSAAPSGCIYLSGLRILRFEKAPRSGTGFTYCSGSIGVSPEFQPLLCLSFIFYLFIFIIHSSFLIITHIHKSDGKKRTSYLI